MATRDSFTPQEWDVLVNTPDAVCLAMIAAQEGGAVDERSAYFSAWRDSGDQPFGDNQLVLTILRTRNPNSDEMAFQAQREESFSTLEPGPTREAALAYCRSAGQLLHAKGSPQDLAAYHQWLLFIAERVAQSSKSGGFLGFGGKAISDPEHGLMNDISAALNG